MIALLDKKSVLKKCSIAAVGATLSFVAIFFTVRMIHDSITRAITQNGATVTLSYNEDNKIKYGEDLSHWTNLFSVESGPQTFTAFCANPSRTAPESGANFNAHQISDDSSKSKLIRLMAYIYTRAANDDIANDDIARVLMNDFFGSLPSDPDTDTPLYAYAQATIGYIHSDRSDTGDLSSEIIGVIDGVANTLQAKIENNDDIWLMAKNYKLFETVVPNNSIQAMVWIEDANTYGNIAVQKKDSGTQSNTPQGGGSLAGIKFSVYNASGERIYNPNDGKFYNDGEPIAEATTNEDGKATFSNLPANILYRVQETGTNNSYLMTAAAQDITLASGAPNELSFEDDIVRGDVKFTKKDNNGEPMANVVFRIQSNSYPYEYHFVISDENGIVDTSNQHAQHTNNTNGYDNMENKHELTYLGYGTWFGEAPVDNSKGALPYDSYTITEWECNANKFCQNTNLPQKIFYIDKDTIGDDLLYELDDWENECADFSLSTTAMDGKDDDKFIEASGGTIIKDTVKYCAKPGMKYTIKGTLMDKSTGKALLVSGETIKREVPIEPTGACGTVDMNFDVDTTELEGKEIVVFENMYYGEELVASHEDIKSEGQTVTVISLGTFATNKETEEKLLPLDEDVVVKDDIKYCLKPGEAYTAKGVLMDKSTGDKLLIDDKPVEAEITFTPEEACGTVTMDFEFNTKDLGGVDLVVFESLYHDDKLILKHHDLENKDETVSVAPPTPDTGFITKSAGHGGNTINMLYVVGSVVVLSVGGYCTYRHSARRKFMKKR